LVIPPDWPDDHTEEDRFVFEMRDYGSGFFVALRGGMLGDGTGDYSGTLNPCSAILPFCLPFASPHSLAAHRWSANVVLGKLEDSPEGVKVHGRLNLETAGGKEAYSNLRKGIVKALSIGFELIAHAFEGAVRVIKQGVIREVSLVIFPANPAAIVTTVKTEQDCAARYLTPYLSRVDGY
jgi:HK97 family phage prohead protease